MRADRSLKATEAIRTPGRAAPSSPISARRNPVPNGLKRQTVIGLCRSEWRVHEAAKLLWPSLDRDHSGGVAVLRKMGLLLMPLSYVIEGSDWSWSTRRGMRSESPTPWDRCRIHKKWRGGWRRGSALGLRILQGVPQLEHPATPAPPRP